MAIQTTLNLSAMGQVLKVNKERKKQHKSDKYIVWLNEQAQNNPSLERVYEIGLIGAYFHLSFNVVSMIRRMVLSPTDSIRSVSSHNVLSASVLSIFLEYQTWVSLTNLPSSVSLKFEPNNLITGPGILNLGAMLTLREISVSLSF